VTGRLAVLVVLAAVVAVAAWAYRRRSVRDGIRGPGGLPPVPAELLGPGTTWVIFTTPLCGSCAAVEAELRRSRPDDTVVKVDATVHAALAGAYDVRRAPTVLRAGADGRVTERLVGPDAVRARV